MNILIIYAKIAARIMLRSRCVNFHNDIRSIYNLFISCKELSIPIAIKIVIKIFTLITLILLIMTNKYKIFKYKYLRLNLKYHYFLP